MENKHLHFNTSIGVKKPENIRNKQQACPFCEREKLTDFIFNTNSYNIFFYHFNGKIYAKVVPRFVTTPLYIGYGLPQVPNNIEWMADQVKSIYFGAAESIM